ncbi:ABC transporter permease [Meiothermus sp.]|uniref:ABC transporter permease n=1 Tax=Meiothermus sp. TaxID=1955249 RepID=UPI0021DC836D|nr:ABC transporter permease [Meiothermus sp.]GIW33345.1 MAG: hypothetical protein KatS3mg072_0678 [Meiothermus sp.]
MIRVVQIEFWRFLRSIIRYPLELIGGVMGAAVGFALFFIGVRYLAGSALFGERLEAMVISLLAWTLAFSLLSTSASTISEEALTGLMEQLALTRPGLLGLVLVRAALSILYIGLLNIPVFLSILATSGARLDLQPLALLPLATLAFSALGLGLMLGGLALVYKRVGQLLGVLQYVLLGLFLVRFEALTLPWNALGSLLPLVPSASALRIMLGQGQDPGWELLLLAGVNALAYLALGIGLFQRAIRRARQQGSLGTY